MEVVLLGTGTLVPDADRRATGLLVRSADRIVSVDLGRGVLDRAVQAGVDPLELPDFFLTHLHPDHSADLVSLLFALRHGRDEAAPVSLHGPRGLAELVGRIGAAWPAAAPDEALTIHEIAGGECLEGPLRVRAEAVHHGDHAALGFRIEESSTGRAMAFTGDSGPGPGLDRLCADVDLLVAECGDGLHPRRGRHLDVASFLELARRSRAAQVVVTHLDPRGDRQGVIRELRDALGARLVVGEDLMVLRV